MERESWIIRNRVTGEVIAETWLPHVVAALNIAKYEAVPVLQHLQEVNRPGTLAYAWIRREAHP